MLRQESLDEIWDGRRYGLNDMVRADSGGCKNCSKCCETMTDTIILGPLDIFRIEKKLNKSFEELLDGCIKLNMHDGVILPSVASNEKGCVFLSEEKRCTIHDSRPDFCRLFPLGRLYENGSYSYILQVGQCTKSCSKVKVKKWIDTPEYEKNREYILAWHGLIRRVGELVVQLDDESRQKSLLMGLIQLFYGESYGKNTDFYTEFAARVERFEKNITDII